MVRSYYPASLSEALRMLEREGIVSKRHGTGNFYHSSALDLSMRIDTNLDFTELLADGGRLPHAKKQLPSA